MKKIQLFVGALAMLGLTACQSDDLQGGKGDDTSVRLTATLADGVATRASIDDTGKGTKADECILQIYEKEGDGDNATYTPYGSQTKVSVNDLKAQFSNVRVVSGKTYKFVFWADNKEGDYYNDTDLRNITIKNTAENLNDDKRDAFFGSYEATITKDIDQDVELTRPFGQVNLTATDYQKVPDDRKPNEVQIVYATGGYEGLNALTGETTGSQLKNITTTTANIMDNSNGYMAMDYLFAPQEQDGKENPAIVDFTTNFYKDGTLITSNNKTTNIPVRRNYRTNISGNLLTNGANLNVTVLPGFSGTIITPYTDETTLNDGGSWIVNDGTASIDLSKVDNLKSDLNLYINGTTSPVNIQLGSKAESDHQINIIVLQNAKTPTFTVANGAKIISNLNVTSYSKDPTTKGIFLNAPMKNVTFSGLYLTNKGMHLQAAMNNVTITKCNANIVNTENNNDVDFVKVDGTGAGSPVITGSLNITDNTVYIKTAKAGDAYLANLWQLTKGTVNITGNHVSGNCGGVFSWMAPDKIDVENNDFECESNGVVIQRPNGENIVKNNTFKNNTLSIFFSHFETANKPTIEITGNTINNGIFIGYDNEADCHATLKVKDNTNIADKNSTYKKLYFIEDIKGPNPVTFENGSDYANPFKD
ncbi:MAG TPA: hypothetical protein DEQ17_05680 [Prevotella sp.]|nr:hypothetical protein [Prevotella sp.]